MLLQADHTIWAGAYCIIAVFLAHSTITILVSYFWSEQESGMTPDAWLRRQRLQDACHSLCDDLCHGTSCCSVTTVAAE